MNDESRPTAAHVNLATRSSTSVHRGSGFDRRVRQHRRVCREQDRQIDRIYGIREPYPYPNEAA